MLTAGIIRDTRIWGYNSPAKFAEGVSRSCLRWSMVIAFPDGVPRRLDEYWRARLESAQERYAANRNEATIAAYKAALKTFSDLVLRGRVPEQ
jgi:hypothetical protein